MSRTKTPKASKKQPPKKKPVKKRASIVPKKKDGTIDWKRYNEALVERGSITFWIETETVEGWVEEPDVKARGGQRVYSDAAIACILTMRSVFHLALRNVEGFCRSLLAETKRNLPTPNFTTLSRRCGQLEVPLPRSLPKGAIDIVVDSTGIKVYGEGEWKVRQHGVSKRRTWLKLHLAIDVKTQEVCATVVSTADVSDDEAFAPILEQIEDDLASVGGDGAYDKGGVRERIEARGATPRIPPRRDARLQNNKSCVSPLRQQALAKRDDAIRRIEELQRTETKGDLSEARKLWKQETHYHRRSLAETAMYRYKTIFGQAVRARIFGNQTKELCLNIVAMNKMTRLGIPSTLTQQTSAR
jgi:hypothetical protein